MRSLLNALVLTLAFSSTAVASVKHGTIEGIWSTKAGCDWKKNSNNPASVAPENFLDFVYLTESGIEGYEWGCQFVSSFKGNSGETVSIGSCSAEGEIWPQLMITNWNDKEGWGVSVLNDKNEPEQVFFPVQCTKENK